MEESQQSTSDILYSSLIWWTPAGHLLAVGGDTDDDKQMVTQLTAFNASNYTALIHSI